MLKQSVFIFLYFLYKHTFFCIFLFNLTWSISLFYFFRFFCRRFSASSELAKVIMWYLLDSPETESCGSSKVSKQSLSTLIHFSRVFPVWWLRFSPEHFYFPFDCSNACDAGKNTEKREIKMTIKTQKLRSLLFSMHLIFFQCICQTKKSEAVEFIVQK